MPIYNVTVARNLIYKAEILADTPREAVDDMVSAVEDGEIEPLNPNEEAALLLVKQVEEKE